MSDYKPITGELREKLAEYEPQETGDAFVARQVGRTGYDVMIAMCDAIDAIHAGLERENAELKAELDRVTGEHEKAIQQALMGEGGVPATDENMAEHGWVRLPVDGEAPCKQLGEWIEKRGLITGPLDHDGELWHKGDMSASPWGVIENIVYENGKWFIRGHDTSAPWLPANSLLHYHAPTVEDLLREFALKVAGEECMTMRTGVVEEYAEKLREVLA